MGGTIVPIAVSVYQQAPRGTHLGPVPTRATPPGAHPAGACDPPARSYHRPS